MNSRTGFCGSAYCKSVGLVDDGAALCCGLEVLLDMQWEGNGFESDVQQEDMQCWL